MEDFIFDGKTLSSFGYVLCAFNGLDIETTPISNMEYTTIKAPLSDVSAKVSSDYPENLTTTIQICKSPCEYEYDDIITAHDISELSKWLCRKNYKWFSWVDKSDFAEVCYEAQIKMNKITLYGKCIGLELVINTNRPYAVTPLINTKVSGNNFKITAFSDEDGYIYPDVKIVVKGSGDLILTNNYDNSSTEIKNCVEGETIYIYGDILQIETDSDREIYKDFNYVFPRLISSYEKYINEFVSNMECDINISYRGIRKVGI